MIGRNIDASGGFPFCRFYLVEVTSQAIDNQPSDNRTYKFAIDIFQENTNKTKATAEADFEDAVDAVLDKLNAQWKVPDGSSVPTVDNSVIGTSPVREVEMGFGPALVCTISFEAKTLIY